MFKPLFSVQTHLCKCGLVSFFLAQLSPPSNGISEKSPQVVSVPYPSDELSVLPKCPRILMGSAHVTIRFPRFRICGRFWSNSFTFRSYSEMFTDELAAVGILECNLSKVNEEPAVWFSPGRLNVVR